MINQEYKWVKEIVEAVMLNAFDSIEKRDKKTGEWYLSGENIREWIKSIAGQFWINALYQVSDVDPNKTSNALISKIENRGK